MLTSSANNSTLLRAEQKIESVLSYNLDLTTYKATVLPDHYWICIYDKYMKYHSMNCMLIVNTIIINQLKPITENTYTTLISGNLSM